MKVIIAGSRTIVPSSKLISECIKKSGFDVTEIVEGEAAGVDLSAASYAVDRGIPIKRFPAEWKKYGRIAGPIRNKQMAEYADALILIWDGQSAGSKNMKRTAKELKLPVFEHKVVKAEPSGEKNIRNGRCTRRSR